MKLLKHQFWHFLTLSVLLMAIYFYANNYPDLLVGEYLGVSTYKWFLWAILIPIIHQLYVLICWRVELFYTGMTKVFGESGFTLYKIGFALLFVSRLLTIIILAIASAETLHVNATGAYVAAFILFIPAVYLFYSVKKYFGIDRAFGIDHFQPEKLKNEPFVKKGIFKYTSNGMYIYGFLLLWIPGLLLLSKAALIAALFNHLYIWTHYYFTELPDIKIIYRG